MEGEHMRRASLRLTAIALSLLALQLTSGCSRSRHGSDERYYLLATNIKIPYWQVAADGLLRAATDLGVQAEMVGPEKYDATEEREHFRNIVGRKPAGILVSVADPEVLKSEIASAIAAGIPVVTIDSDAPGTKRLFFIGTNNYQAGLTGGRLLAKRLGGKGSVVVLTMPAQANLVERRRGYEDAFAETGIRIVDTIDVQGEPSVAFDKTMALVESNKVPDAFVCLEAMGGPEVAEVLSRKNIRDKLIIAMDTDERTFTWIEKGTILATIGQKPFTMAYVGLRMLDDLHHNKPQPLDTDWSRTLHALVPSVVDTGSTLIDQSNLNEVRSQTK
jgi:ribose transport system substrate-binding protein